MNYSPIDSAVREGDVVDDKYVVESVIGVGGMGMVVAARHRELGQQVALKFLLPAGLGVPGAVERFMREARSAVQLQSQHVARVYDVGRLEDGTPYLVMELLTGCDLGSLVKQRGPLRTGDVVEYVIQACEAVAEAHGLGIVHRDLKPANLFLTRRLNGAPLVKVLDFGISKVINLSPTDPSLTKTSDVVGSPYYMAPEQVRSARDVDARTDIWALGVILYELLAGRVPFVATNVPQLCAKLLEEEPTPLIEVRPDVPAELSFVVSTCLRKRPEERFASVQDLVRAIAPFAAIGVEGTARPRSFSELATVDVPPLPVRSSLTLGQTIQHDSRAGSGHVHAAMLVREAGATTAQGGATEGSSGKSRSWLAWAAPVAGLFALVSLAGAFWLIYATLLVGPAETAASSTLLDPTTSAPITGAPIGAAVPSAVADADSDEADVGAESATPKSPSATAGSYVRPPKGQPAPTKTAAPSSATTKPAPTVTSKTVEDFMPSDRK